MNSVKIHFYTFLYLSVPLCYWQDSQFVMIINEISFLSPADIKVLLQEYFSAERLIIKFNFEYSLKEFSHRI